MKTIMWIDDDVASSTLRAYRDEIKENGFDLIPVDCVDELNKKEHLYNTVDLIILDSMIPVGELLKNENDTKGGIFSGILIYEKLLKNLNLPIIIFSILSDEYLINWQQSNNFEYLNKLDTDPERLITKINIMLS